MINIIHKKNTTSAAIRSHRLTLLTALLCSFCYAQAYGSELNIPNQFSSGTPAIAAQVNENFSTTAASVNDNFTQVTAALAQLATLQTTITDLQDTIASLQTTVNNQQNTIASLQASSVDGLADFLSIEVDRQGNPAAVFSAVNLHLNNGEASKNTETINGLGNLIIGFDEESISTRNVCSHGGFDSDAIFCQSNGHVWSTIHKSGSHNLVVGPQHNYSQSGGFVSGMNNTINQISASISGGSVNTASGFLSSVSGGSGNTASGYLSSVSGGINNLADGINSSILGGERNSASGDRSSISGGDSNTSSGYRSSVSGGLSNTAGGTYSSVSGGDGRNAPNSRDWAAGTLFEND
ncbi:MAG: hypothetical protein K6L75_06595 [Cellvibrionaceae bacterium]